VRKTFWTLVFTLLTAVVWAAGSEWKRFDSGRFSILMPQTPKPAANSQWVASDAFGRAYNASAGYLTTPPGKAKEYFDHTVATAVEGTHGRLLYQRSLKVQGLPACEFKLTDGSHTLAGRLVLDKSWVYILEFATNTKDFDVTLMKKFFDSFHINELGK